jgi:phosphatidylethanolamine-binding protein (PEBP) family uncharacterized protein
MIIKYNNKTIKNGQFLTPLEASETPIVTHNKDPKQLYTLIVHDPDAPAGNHLHWIVVNIPGANINKGIHVLPYDGPHPPPKSGTHHYIFKLFKQTQKINKSLMFKRVMPQQDVLDKFDNIIGKPIDTGHFTSAFTNTKPVGRKNKTRKNKTRKNKTRKNKTRSRSK